MSIANVATNSAGFDRPAWRDWLKTAMAPRCLMKPRDGFVSLLPVLSPSIVGGDGRGGSFQGSAKYDAGPSQPFPEDCENIMSASVNLYNIIPQTRIRRNSRSFCRGAEMNSIQCFDLACLVQCAARGKRREAAPAAGYWHYGAAAQGRFC
jgi:hypothetical protein